MFGVVQFNPRILDYIITELEVAIECILTSSIMLKNKQNKNMHCTLSQLIISIAMDQSLGFSANPVVFFLIPSILAMRLLWGILFIRITLFIRVTLFSNFNIRKIIPQSYAKLSS